MCPLHNIRGHVVAHRGAVSVIVKTRRRSSSTGFRRWRAADRRPGKRAPGGAENNYTAQLKNSRKIVHHFYNHSPFSRPSASPVPERWADVMGEGCFFAGSAISLFNQASIRWNNLHALAGRDPPRPSGISAKGKCVFFFDGRFF